MPNKILVAMSGGVDSAAAAIILKKENIVCGGTLVLCGSNESYDAKTVCEHIGIPHYVFDEKKRFKTFVMDSFAECYMRGETPNPCIVCNKKIKFGVLLDNAISLGYEKIATGHYARVELDSGSGRYLLKKAKDKNKDQSYVLYTLSQEVLSRCVFPISDFTKDEIRDIVSEAGLNIAGKKESQDICFIPDKDYRKFLAEEYGVRGNAGDFVLSNGEIVGRHNGTFAYTTGQRKGLGVSYKTPLYVVGKDIENNRVILGENSDLYKKRIYIKDTNWIPMETLTTKIRAEGKVRYSQSVSGCIINPLEGKRAVVEFDDPQRAPTEGQSAVFYDGDTVIGGGVVTKAFS